MAVGKAAINVIDVAINQDLKALLPKEGVDTAYLLHFLIASAGELERRASGATVKGITLDVLRELPISLPPLPEQRRIAAILDQADALRVKRRAALAQLNEMAQAIFVEMFGSPLKDTPSRSLRSGTIRLGDVARIRTGKLDANAANEDGAFPFFTCALKPLKINKAAFDAEAVIVAGNGDLNVKYYSGKFNAYQRTYVIESLNRQKFHSQYLHGFLDLYVERLRQQSIGGIIKYIKLPFLTEAPLPNATVETQIAFTARIGVLKRLRNGLVDSRDSLEALFASLQHRAFRGEL